MDVPRPNSRSPRRRVKLGDRGPRHLLAGLQTAIESGPARPAGAEVHPEVSPGAESAAGLPCGLTRFPADGFTSF